MARTAKSDVRQSQQHVHEALMDGGSGHFTGKLFPDMEHGTVEWWLPDHLPPQRLPDGYADLLIDWTREQVAK